MNHPSANNRSLPLGTSNYLYKTIIPQNNDYFPVYEFNLPKLDLRVVVKIVCNAYVTSSSLFVVLSLCLDLETSLLNFACDISLHMAVNHNHEQC